MGVKMGWIQIKMCHPLARNGAALAPFRANGAHPSYIHITNLKRHEHTGLLRSPKPRFCSIVSISRGLKLP